MVRDTKTGPNNEVGQEAEAGSPLPELVSQTSPTNGGKREPGPGEGDGSEAEAGGPLPRGGSEVEAGAPPSWSSSHRLRPHGQVNESDEKGGQRVEGADLIEQGAPRGLWERP